MMQGGTQHQAARRDRQREFNSRYGSIADNWSTGTQVFFWLAVAGLIIGPPVAALFQLMLSRGYI